MGPERPGWGWWWLLLSSVFFVLFGLATATLGSIPPASLWGEWIGDWLHGGSFTADEERLYSFMRGPLGGTMAGSYVLQLTIVAIPLRRGERWAWWAVLAGVLTWFVIDSTVSAAHGAWFNVWKVNLVALVTAAIGLAGTWSMTRPAS